MKLSPLKRDLLLIGFAFLTMVTCAWAQSGTTSLHGVVTDKTGAAIVGARVTLSNQSLGLHREMNTGTTGEYEFL